jgi:hypothetical protein
VLHTRTPTGKFSGPEFIGSFESKPTTFQVIGVTVWIGAALTVDCGSSSPASNAINAITEKILKIIRLLTIFTNRDMAPRDY